MILVDLAGHLVSDTSVDELHEFAARHRQHRWYFHNRRGRGHPHYDLTSQTKIVDAIVAGAKLVETRALVKRMARS